MASKLNQTEKFSMRFRKRVFKYQFSTRIHRAARMGNVDKVKSILANGEGGVNDIDRKNRTPLHYACSSGHSEVVALLIENKCNLDILDNSLNTALIKAVEHQHEECIKLLLNNGANPNVQDRDGYSALHCAIFCETTAIAEDLLAHNADMELENQDGHTPLLLALKFNKQPVAELLIQNKANIHAVDKKKRTALILASKFESEHIIELLLQGGINALAEDQSGRNALSYAIDSGYNVRLILENSRTEIPYPQSSDEVGDDSLTSKSGLVEAGPASSGSKNKSDTKNVPEGKGEVCEDSRDSRRDEEKCVAKSGENQALDDNNNSDSEVERVVPTLRARHIKVKSLYGTPPSSPDSNNVRDGEGEVCETSRYSRSEAKGVSQSGENQALHDNSPDREEKRGFSALPVRHIKVKSFHGTPPSSSPDPKNVRDGEGEVCETSRYSRSEAKGVSQSGENQALHDNSPDREEKRGFSALPVRHIKVKSFHGTPPSSSPDPKNVRDGEGEVCETSRYSRSEAKGVSQSGENQALHDNSPDREEKRGFSALPARHIKAKSFHGTPPSSSPDPKNVRDGEGEVCETSRYSRSEAKGVSQSGENHALNDNSPDREEKRGFSALPVRHIKAKSFHGTPPSSSPDPKNVCDGIGEVCETSRYSRSEAKGVSQNGENQALHDNSSDREEKRGFSALPVRHIKVKSFHGTPPSSSPNPKNVRDGEGEVCETSRYSRSEAKGVSQSGENQALHDNSSDREEKRGFSALPVRHIKVKSFHGTLPSSSPDPKNVRDGEGEVCETSRYSRSEAKGVSQSGENQALHDNSPDREEKRGFSALPVRHIKVKSFHGTPPSSSPDPKNVRDGEGEVCETSRYSRSEAKGVSQSGENQALHDNSPDREEKRGFSALPVRHIKVKSFHGTPPSSSPDPKNVRDGEGEVCETSRYSRSEAKGVSQSGENQALHDNSPDKEEKCGFSALPVRHIKVKSFHGTPPSSSPDPKNVRDGEGVVCETSRYSRSEAKGVSQSGENQALHDINPGREEKCVFSAPPARCIKVKSLHGTRPSLSPNPKNICEGKEEVCDNFQQSRNDVKCDPGNQKNRALIDRNVSESEREHVVSTIYVRHIKEKSLGNAPQTSPDSKDKEHPIEREESQNLHKSAEGTYDNDDHESTEQREIGKTDHERFSLRKYQEHDGLTEVASNEKGKIKKQASVMEDLDNLCQSSEMASKDFESGYPNYKKTLLLIEQHKASCKDSVSLSKIKDAVISSQKPIEDKKCHCSQCLLLLEKFAKMENKFCELEMKLLEAISVKSKLEDKKEEWRQKLFNMRCDLQEEQKQRINAEHFLKKFRSQLRQKEEDYNKEREIRTQLEISLKTRDMELSTARNKLTQVSTSDETGKDLLDKYHSIEDNIAIKRLEIDTIKHENQEKEKKYLESIEIIKGKYDDLQKTITLNEESFRENLFQHNEQLNNMKTEISMLNFQLECEKQNREKLETEVKFFHNRLTDAPSHPHESQTSKGYQELAFQRAMDEYLHSQAQINFDLSRLKVKNEYVSQELAQYEIKVSSLESKLHQTRLDLEEINLVVENVQRDLRRTQCQMKEIKHTWQSEQTKVNNYDGRWDSTEERLQLQNENTLLQQQMHELHNKSDNRDTVIRMQRELHDIVEKYQAENKKNNLILEKKIQKLSNKYNHLEERLCQ